MLFKKYIRKSVTALIATAILAQCIPVFAGDESAIIFKEDYQAIANGGSPIYGASNWSGDTASSHGECVIGVVNENGNKSFKMQYTGEGKKVTADPLVYRNVSVMGDEVHMFTTRMKTDDTNQYKRLFIRTATGGQIELFSFNGPKVRIVGSDAANLVKGRWYEVKVVLDGKKKTADVYVDGTYGGTCFLQNYDITNISLRITMLGATTAGVTTNVYIDNVAYANKNIKVNFDEPEYIEELPPTEEGEEEFIVTNKEISVFSIDNTKAYILGEFMDTGIKTTVYRGNTVIPLRNIALACGTEVTWNGDKGCAELNLNGNTVAVSNDYIEINGEKQEIKATPYNIADRLYLDTNNAELVTGKTIVADMSGAVSLYDKEPKTGEVSAILDELAFTEPAADEILADFKSYNSKNSHPRILMDKARLEKIREYIKGDTIFTKWYEQVKVKADKALTAKISEYELRDGERLLYISREAHENIIYPAFAYLIDGDRKYLERAVSEMMAVSEFKDWHPIHFLDTAEMTLAVAIGYDWLHDSLTKKQKETISNAILRLGLDAANEAYEGTAEYDNTVFGAYHNRIGWKADPSNWGLVCNGGIATGALALMGDYETEYCADIVSKALKGLKVPMKLYAPDGAWSEGVGYWSYACNYLGYMLSSVKNTLGTDYDYTMVPGILATANYPIYHLGPTGIFNYGDATEATMSAPILFWFANELGEPSLNEAKLGLMDKFGYKGDIYDILFYNPDLVASVHETEKDKKFRIVETAVSANSSASKNANYIAIKGGTVGETHGDLDAGTFVLDSMGERWVMDLGSDSYTLDGYFDWSKRINYYRKRAEGHSTLVLNPDGGADQKLGGKTVISEMAASNYGSCAVVDLTNAYIDDAKSVKRASLLFDNRNKFMIQDEVVSEKPTDVYWFMQTPKSVEIAPDGKSLILSDGNSNADGKRMKLILNSTCKNAVFTCGPAEPLEVSPKGEGQTKNLSVQRICVKSEGVKNLNMQVIFIPYIVDEGCDTTNLPALMSIDDLVAQKNIDFKSATYTELKDLTVDGKTVDFFDPTLKYYDVKFEADYKGTPFIGAASDFEVSITQPESVNDMAKVEVKDTTGKLKTQTYYIKFSKERQTSSINEKMKEIPLKSAEASAVVEPQNPPENCIDNDPSTKWAANGKQWIKFDLGSVKKIDAVGLLWMNPTERTQKYSVEVSTDNSYWTQIFNGMSLGDVEGTEYILTDGIEAQFVRVSVNGTTAGTWSSLMEAKVYAE